MDALDLKWQDLSLGRQIQIGRPWIPQRRGTQSSNLGRTHMIQWSTSSLNPIRSWSPPWIHGTGDPPQLRRNSAAGQSLTRRRGPVSPTVPTRWFAIPNYGSPNTKWRLRRTKRSTSHQLWRSGELDPRWGVVPRRIPCIDEQLRRIWPPSHQCNQRTSLPRSRAPPRPGALGWTSGRGEVHVWRRGTLPVLTLIFHGDDGVLEGWWRVAQGGSDPFIEARGNPHKRWGSRSRVTTLSRRRVWCEEEESDSWVLRDSHTGEWNAWPVVCPRGPTS
jgi:hypothetical protein